MASQMANRRGESIVGLLRETDAAERCIVELKRLGIQEQNILVAHKTRPRERAATQETGATRVGPQGGLVGILNVLGLGSDLVRSLKGLGFSDETAHRYADLVDAENILLAVRCGGQCEKVTAVLDKRGAFDVRHSGPPTGAVPPTQ